MPTPADIATSKPIFPFIAYAREAESIRDPRPDAAGDPMTIRVQTFVRYSPAVKIKAIEQNKTGKSVVVTFDGASVGYGHDFSGHLSNEDPGVGILTKAYEEGRPVAVGLEAHRKNSADGTAISRVAPIHLLRGGDEKGRKANSNITHSNIGANTIAYVDGHTTIECASDPNEWPELCDTNVSGLVAPLGWRVVTSAEWGEYSFIAEDRESRGGGSIDASAIADVVYAAIVRYHEENANGIAHAAGGVPTEGAPWTVRTSDGRLSLGSYAHDRYSDLLVWWTRTLRNHPKWSQRGIGPVQPMAQVYAHHTFTLVNKIVSCAYNEPGKPPFPADPNKRSWHTAWDHLRNLLNDALYEASEGDGEADGEDPDVMVFVGGEQSEEDWREWNQYWGQSATQSVRHAAAVLEDFYSTEWEANRKAARNDIADRKTATRKQQPAQQQSAKPAAKTASTPPADNAPTTAAPASENAGDQSIRDTLYAAVGNHWDNVERLTAILAQMDQKGMLDLKVSATLAGGKLTSLTDPKPDAKVDKLTKLIDWRVKNLSKSDPAQPAAGNTSSGNTLGVDVPPKDRVTEIQQLIAGATSTDDCDDLEALLNSEGLADSDITLADNPSSLGIYLRFRRNQLSKA